MKTLKQFFRLADHTLVNLSGRARSENALVPYVNYDENVLDTHLLKQTQQFGPATLFCAIFKTLSNECVVLGFFHMFRLIFIRLCDSVSDDCCFCVLNTFFLPQVRQAQVYVILT